MDERLAMREGTRVRSLKAKSPTRTHGMALPQASSKEGPQITVCLKSPLSKTDAGDCDQNRGARVNGIPPETAAKLVTLCTDTGDQERQLHKTLCHCFLTGKSSEVKYFMCIKRTNTNLSHDCFFLFIYFFDVNHLLESTHIGIFSFKSFTLPKCLS